MLALNCRFLAADQALKSKLIVRDGHDQIVIGKEKWECRCRKFEARVRSAVVAEDDALTFDCEGQNLGTVEYKV